MIKKKWPKIAADYGEPRQGLVICKDSGHSLGERPLSKSLKKKRRLAE